MAGDLTAIPCNSLASNRDTVQVAHVHTVCRSVFDSALRVHRNAVVRTRDRYTVMRAVCVHTLGTLLRLHLVFIIFALVLLAEFDVVVNLPALSAGNLKLVQEEMRTLQNLTERIRIKAIMETGHRWYSEAYIKAVSRALHDAGIWCLKTSTGKYDIETPAGFLPRVYFDQKLRHAHCMHEACPDMMIKVAGGIKTLQEVRDVCSVTSKERVLIGTSNPIWGSILQD